MRKVEKVVPKNPVIQGFQILTTTGSCTYHYKAANPRRRISEEYLTLILDHVNDDINRMPPASAVVVAAKALNATISIEIVRCMAGHVIGTHSQSFPVFWDD